MTVFIEELLRLINQMSPYLLLGFLMAGLMHEFVPRMLYTRYLSGDNLRSVTWAALFGIPLPLCSCGVIPTAMSLRREGASRGATVSFLIATPQTGIDSIIATYSLMGLPFAIIRPIAALATALFGGTLANLSNNGADTEQAHDCSIEGCQPTTNDIPLSFWAKTKGTLRYAYVDMMQDIGRWLILGLIMASIITTFVPESLFEVFKDNSLLSMLLVLCISVPMYLCATGSIPIAVALIMKGLTPGAGLVLLMAGPACNVASVLVVNKVLGRRTLLIYLASIVIGAITLGLAIDHILPREWFISNLTYVNDCCTHNASWWTIVCSIILLALLTYALVNRYWPKRNNKRINKDMTMTFIIEGMNCNHCRTSAEKAIQSIPGVTNATVDLATKLAVVEGTASAEAICKVIEEVGFTCKEQI